MTFLTFCRVCQEPRTGNEISSNKHAVICHRCRRYRRADVEALLAYWRECDQDDAIKAEINAGGE